MADDVERLAEVVAQHYPHLFACSCSAAIKARALPDKGEREAAWGAHVAEHLAPLLAEVRREGQAEGAREERLGWSSWLDSWLSAVGPEPPTVEAVAEWLRADSKPWGRAAALASGRGTVCPHGDPTCPCPDGLACHYEDLPGSPAMTPPSGRGTAGEEAES